ncbi:hypothetical protein ACFWBI_21290 [Streptomyces sp. NPDC059982]
MGETTVRIPERAPPLPIAPAAWTPPHLRRTPRPDAPLVSP